MTITETQDFADLCTQVFELSDTGRAPNSSSNPQGNPNCNLHNDNYNDAMTSPTTTATATTNTSATRGLLIGILTCGYCTAITHAITYFILGCFPEREEQQLAF